MSLWFVSATRAATCQSSIHTSSWTNTSVSSLPAASIARLNTSGSGRVLA